MQALLEIVKGQRSSNIAVVFSKVAEIVGQRTNKAAYTALGKIEYAAKKHRTVLEERAIRRGILIKTIKSTQMVSYERKNWNREWLA
jgi:hypothetical protein